MNNRHIDPNAVGNQDPIAGLGVGIGGTADPITPAMQQRLKENARRAARDDILALYRRRGGSTQLGVFGHGVGDLVEHSDGSYSQGFEYGSIRTASINLPLPEEFYVCDIDIAAIKCFGTEDPSGEDEPYVIITSVIPAAAFFDGRSTGNIVKVWRSPTFEGIEAREIFGENLSVFRNLLVAPFGISLKILLMDHEHGSEAELERLIREKGDKLAREGLEAAAALAQLPLNEQIENQVLNTETMRTLGDISVNVLTDLLKDDKIDEKTWQIDAAMLKDWVDNNRTISSEVAYPPSELPSHLKSNFPRENVFDRTWLFSGGGGSYKMYLRIIPKKVTVAPS